MKTAWVLYASSQPQSYNVASVQRALEKNNFSVVLVDLFDLRVDSLNQLRHCVTHEIYSVPDVIVPATGIRTPILKLDLAKQHGTFPLMTLPDYENETEEFADLSSQQLINRYIYYKEFHAYQSVNIIDSWSSFKPHSIRDHILASEKDYAFVKFRENNVPTARTTEFGIMPNFDFTIAEITDAIKTMVGEPFVVKSVSGSNGEGTEYCATVLDLPESCKKAWARRPGSMLLAQEYIGHSAGMIVSVGIAGEQIFPVARVGSPDLDAFKSDTQEGRLQVAYKVTEPLQQLTVAARKALNLEYLRFDMMIGQDGQFKIIEANSPGGMNIVSNTHNQEFAAVIVAHTLKLYENANAT